MTIEADLYSRLTGHAGLAALIGTRLYPDAAPQNASRPYVVYQRISTTRWQALSGVVVAASPRFQLTVYADSVSDLVSVAAQLRAAVLAMADSTVTVYERTLDNESTGYDDESHLFRRDLDVRILHSE